MVLKNCHRRALKGLIEAQRHGKHPCLCPGGNIYLCRRGGSRFWIDYLRIVDRASGGIKHGWIQVDMLFSANSPLPSGAVIWIFSPISEKPPMIVTPIDNIKRCHFVGGVEALSQPLALIQLHMRRCHHKLVDEGMIRTRFPGAGENFPLIGILGLVTWKESIRTDILVICNEVRQRHVRIESPPKSINLSTVIQVFGALTLISS